MIQKFISKLSQKEKKILVLTIIFVLLAFLDRVFFGPALANLKSLQDDIRYKENSLKRDLRFISYKDQILEEKEVLKKYYTKKQLTPGEIKEAFLNKIELLAQQANLSSVRVTPSEGERKKGYTEYSANLECQGKLKDVVVFMHSIDSAEELMKVYQLNMTAKKSSAEEISASMMISTIIVELDLKEEILAPPLASINQQDPLKEKSILIKSDAGSLEKSSPSTATDSLKDKTPVMNAEISETEDTK